ncbi:12040_t:CDS:2, partial [Ambispora gerdemannii]
KLHSDNYSTLSRLAWDYLAIPTSSVPSESTFSIEKHTISTYESSGDDWSYNIADSDNGKNSITTDLSTSTQEQALMFNYDVYSHSV